MVKSESCFERFDVIEEAMSQEMLRLFSSIATRAVEQLPAKKSRICEPG
jgi:hypothetical protein